MRRQGVRGLWAGVVLGGVATVAAAETAVLVELAEDPAAVHAARAALAGAPLSDAELAAYRETLGARQEAFLDALRSRGVAFSPLILPVADFDGAVHAVPVRLTLVLNAVALRVDSGALPAIAAHPGVARLHRDRLHRPLLDRSVAYTRAPEVYGAVPELEPGDDLREGLEGQGIAIAVIDTGIEWSHPMFGGDPTPPRFGLAPAAAATPANAKVVYYLPLVDGVADDFGHGTHAAADAAGYLGLAPGGDGVPGTGDDVALHGVAPQARLMGYKVCSGAGSATATVGCPGTAIALAIEDAVSPRTLTGFAKPVAQVINLSLGGEGGPDDFTAEAADNAALLGTIVVASAGNEGPGEGTVGSPAAGQHVLAVGAGNDPGVFPNSVEVLAPGGGVEPGSRKLAVILAPDSNLRRPVAEPFVEHYVDAGLADTPDQVPVTVLGRICLVERGSTVEVEAADTGSGLFAWKAANCAAKGAIAVLVFNDQPGALEAVLAPAAIPVLTLSRADGLYLRDTLGFDAAGISRFALRINPEDPTLFAPQMAGFSSRGPVQGLGQVKPDVAAPGVSVLAATSPLGVPVVSMQDATRYTAASGTSFSGPHVAGAAALVKQARPEWGPAEVRTALINTATNLRDAAGRPKPEGTGADPVLAQGGGLIDVAAAVAAPALLGVLGDGVAAPRILGSHSFGAIPVVDSRVPHSEAVTVHLVDVSGEGGSWQLEVANNRDLELAGVEVTLSSASVTLASGGAAAVTVAATIDGDVVREVMAAKIRDGEAVVERLQVQFYVVARRSDGATLRMPFYLRPDRSLPSGAVSSRSETFEGMVPAGDTGLELLEDLTYVDVDFGVDAATFQIDARLEFDEPIDGLYPDLDLLLLDPDGEVLASSTNAGGPEALTARSRGAGTYTYRVVGWLNGATAFRLESTQQLGGEPPRLLPIAGDFVDSLGRAVDFDGAFAVAWQPSGGESGFEVERSLDGGLSWQAVAQVAADTASIAFSEQPSGEQRFRMRALYPGQIGFFVTAPGNVEVVVVDHRVRKKITNKVQTAVGNVSFAAGVFQLDLNMANEASDTWVPLVELEIVKIKSASGTVTVANADNGGSGRSKKEAALFDYSLRLGEDDEWQPAETTGARTLRFHDPAAELFTFDVVVTAYRRIGPPPPAAPGGGGAPGAPAPAPDDEADADLTAILQFAVNPLTGAVNVQLLEGLL